MKKLVLFDIDGTLIRALVPEKGIHRFSYAIKQIFGKDVLVTVDMFRKYNGWGDRAILWDLLKDSKISRDAFLDKLGAVSQVFCEYLDTLAKQERLYEAIPEAQKLVREVIEAKHAFVGVLTGNLGQTAQWKLRYTGYDSFAFGVFGHEADTRIDLAKLIIPKANVHFGRKFNPRDIVLIGDTVHDIACTRAIGASVVIVSTGWNVERTALEKAKPDIFVNSLADKQVYEYLELD